MSEGQRKYFVISCDGGGMRGLFGALLLQDLVKTHGQGLLDRVDLFAGTSTGSIMALAMAGGMDADKLVSVYEDKSICEAFFTPNRSWWAVLFGAPFKLLRLSKLFTFIHGLFFPRYSNAGRTKAFRAIFGDLAGRKLSELRKDVLVTAFNLDYKPDWSPGGRLWWPAVFTNIRKHRGPRFLKRFARRFAEPEADITVQDAALCSSSVGMGYESWEHDGCRYADGGFYANNPTAVAVAVLAERGIWDDREVFILSLGTGFEMSFYPNQEGLPGRFPWGVLGWNWPHASSTTVGFPLLHAQADASMEKDHILCQLMLNETHYRRASIPFKPDQSVPYNDCDHLANLRRIAEQFIESAYWRDVREWIGSSWLEDGSGPPSSS